MCGRLSQYTGLHEFVDALSMPNALVNLVGEQPERYNVAPSTAVTTLRLKGTPWSPRRSDGDGGRSGPVIARRR